MDNHGLTIFDKSRGWLSSCIAEHENCHIKTTSTLPRRLLHIRDEKDSRIFLVCTSDKDKDLKYACLSYRWGVVNIDEILRTTSCNFREHFEKGIIIADLPQTIIDTIRVCRELDIEYLWVDSLCIIQPRSKANQGEEHDKLAYDDWKAEGSTMDNAYGNSYITIYAEMAISCQLGFLGFLDRGEPPRDRSNGIDDIDNSGPNTTILDGRGWCLQERFIPKRRLRFLDDEITWECDSSQLCLCGHISDNTYRGYLRGPQGVEPMTYTGSVHSRPDGTNPNHFRLWEGVVADYSWREVSRPEENKLMGVAGLARLLQRTSNIDINDASSNRKDTPSNGQDTYLAGLWRSDLVQSLAWMAMDKRPSQAEADHGVGDFAAPEHKVSRRRYENSTPSWTWASIDGPVAFQTEAMYPRTRGGYEFGGHNPTKENEAIIEEVYVEPKGQEGRFSSVDYGYLLVKSAIAPIQLAIFDENLSANWLSDAVELHGGIHRPVALARGSNMSVSRIILDVDVNEQGPVYQKRLIIPNTDNTAPQDEISIFEKCWIEGSSPTASCRIDKDSKTCDCWWSSSCACTENSCFDKDQNYFGLCLHTWTDKRRTDKRMMSRRGRNGRVIDKESDYPDEMWFLVLKRQKSTRPSDSSTEYEFRRIGIGYCFKNKNKSQWPLFGNHLEWEFNTVKIV